MLKSIRAEMLLDNKKDVFWRVTTTNKKGASSTKVLSHEVYVNMLKNNTIIRKEPKRHRLGSLPYGYVDAIYGEPGDYQIAVLYPAKIRGVKYYNNTYRIPNPNTLFIYDVKRGVVCSKLCFAVKDETITDETILYHYPFGNVGEYGSMCYGNIKLPDVTNMSAIDELVELFLSGDVNDDLYTTSKTTKNCKQFELYEFLEGKKKFPDKILCPVKAYGSDELIRFKDRFK